MICHYCTKCTSPLREIVFSVHCIIYTHLGVARGLGSLKDVDLLTEELKVSKDSDLGMFLKYYFIVFFQNPIFLKK